MTSCFLIGHRETQDGLFPVLLNTVLQHIEEHGVTEFIVGGYGGFDRLAAQAVIQAKEKHPHIMLTLLLPYHPAERPVKKPTGFDSTYYPPGIENVPRRFAIIRANRYIIDHVDYLIAYAWHPASNSRNLLEYAQRRERRGFIHITNLQSKESKLPDSN